MSRLDGETRLFEFGERLTARLDLPRVASALEPWTEWDPGAFALWADLRVSDASILGTVLDEAVPRQFGDVLDRYEQAALGAAGRIGTGRAYEVFGRRLYDHERYSASKTAFARAIELDATLYRSHYYLGRCYERQGADERALEQYELALRQRPDYDDAEEARSHLQDRLSAREERGGGGNGSEAAP
jgi:tetratricopeptide (TPR) repeat protein